METTSLSGFAPDWVVAPIKAQEYKLLDLPNERQNKIAQHNPTLPKLDYPPIIPPAVGPVTYAEQLGKAARQEANQQIAANAAEARHHIRSHYGRLHLVV